MERGLYRGFRRRAPEEETMPRRLTAVTNTVGQTAITAVTDLTGMAIVFTVDKFPVRVTLDCPYVYGSVSGSLPRVSITDSANTELAFAWYSCAGVNFTSQLRVVYEITTAGAYSLKGRYSNGTGTGTVGILADVATVVNRFDATEYRV